MKKTLFLALMLVIGATAFAQQQMATLNHNDTITVFYGSYALRDAHNAAVAGDIVTLSSGTFNSCNITKAITIRGAGFYMDSIAMTYPTIITGDFNLLSPNDSIHNLVMEGINVNNQMRYNNVGNAKFNRCYIDSWRDTYNNGYAKCYDTEFVNCIIKEFYGNSSVPSSYSFVNSVLYHSHMYYDDVTLLNSILIMQESHYNTVAYNSIIVNNWAAYLQENAIAYNCILIKNAYNSVWLNPNNSTNKTVENLSDVFETLRNTNIGSYATNEFSIDERYILKEEIATSFLGNDGTEVGIHGGMFPFDTRPYYMVVKKCNVAKKSTIDGKLSVDIEVMVEE